jgi:citrate lyase subunit beta / citryl-CoA lyase
MVIRSQNGYGIEMKSDELAPVGVRRRSFLFAPGNHPRRSLKAFEFGADVAILDLEDAVAANEKVSARKAVIATLLEPRKCLAYVRVNSIHTSWGYGDLVETIGPRLGGIVLPKTESASQLIIVDWFLSQLEREHDLIPHSVDLMPLVESARGIESLEEICAASPRVRRLAFGGVDYSLDLNLRPAPDDMQLAYARMRLVNCSRAAGLEPPIDTVCTAIHDAEEFRTAARRARQMGFQGKLCIHPDQVALANEAFTPTGEEVARARTIIAAFEAAEGGGNASIEVNGTFVDYPVVEQARRVLALAD